ncbi:MAG TPA: DUF1684 domain-containing protein [Gemmatimonadales bacterium]|nr:DUF1684 domain-containing protein [Gemmatimonadales bacterium]
MRRAGRSAPRVPRRSWPVAVAVALGAPPAGGLAAQLPLDLARERAECAVWLASSPISPYAAVALQPLGGGITLGPANTDVPAPGLGRVRLTEDRGAIRMLDGSAVRIVPRGRPVPLGGGYTLLAAGPAGRTVVGLYGAVRGARPPEYYPFAPDLQFTATLEPPERRGRFLTLGLDGVETEAVEAGVVSVAIGGARRRLRVYQLGEAGREEAELYVYFRDATSGQGSYPAGRFVELVPTGGGRYQLDFNRARNPFCAYSAVYPCPAPWPGNTLAEAVAAGERYSGGDRQGRSDR